MSWFEIDKAGLAAILERRGKEFAVFELLANAYDSSATEVKVSLYPIDGVPYAHLIVEDNSPEGWVNLDDAFTMFSRSRRAGDASKSGRFSLGEKLVLAISRHARIQTVNGSVLFDPSGQRIVSRSRLEKGTIAGFEIKMTRDEMVHVLSEIQEVLPRCRTWINGVELDKPMLLKTFSVTLPTETADDEGLLRRSRRIATVEVYSSDEHSGQILELGIPVVEADWPWKVNVLQKIPLTLERDNVTEEFRKALQVAVVNQMNQELSADQVTQPWVQEAAGDSRATREAVAAVINKQFGDRAVVATPGDPLANGTAEAQGYIVVHGGNLSSDVWANVRKHNLIPSAASIFPTLSADQRANMVKALEQSRTCPVCGQLKPEFKGQP